MTIPRQQIVLVRRDTPAGPGRPTAPVRRYRLARAQLGGKTAGEARYGYLRRMYD